MSGGDNNVVPTLCEEWSLNKDDSSDKHFWWNSTYSLSLWDHSLGIEPPFAQVTDDDVWRKYIEFQLRAVFKMCPVCRKPEGNVDMKICCYCGGTIHVECSKTPSVKQIAWKRANSGFENALCVCHECNNVTVRNPPDVENMVDNTRRCAIRALSLHNELPGDVVEEVKSIVAHAEAPHSSEKEAALRAQLTKAISSFFQPGRTSSMFVKEPIASKMGGLGVVAKENIPSYTIIGVYPGYEDCLGGEQAKLGRPGAKYPLLDLNCADFYNRVFPEFQGCFTPFINEPNVNETSNCAWIQEPMKVEGRLSIITVREVKKGEELLIGYGPMYPRDYPYRYDAYAITQMKHDSPQPCFSVWHWPSTKEEESYLHGYIKFCDKTGMYYAWTPDANDELVPIS